MPPIDGELTPPDDSIRGDLEAAFSGGDDGGSGQVGSVSQSDGDGVSVQGSSDGSKNDRTNDAANAGSSDQNANEDGRARGPDGKFIEKSAVVAPEAPAQVSPSTDAAKASEQPASTPVAAPPAGWTAAEKAEWSKLPPVVQAAVSRREADMTRGGQQWSDEKRRYEAALSPIATLAQARGISAQEGAQRLARAQQMLDADPVAGLREIAKSYGVNLATLAGQNPDEVSSAQTQQPDIRALVRQEVAPLVDPIRQRWQAEEQRQAEMTTQMVVSFAASEGHEHFDSVSDDIMAMIPPLKERNPGWSPQQVLQEAYDRAVYANPATRQTLLTARETAAEDTRRKEAATRATKARGAAVSVTGSPQGSAATESAGSLREEIVRAMTG